MADAVSSQNGAIYQIRQSVNSTPLWQTSPCATNGFNPLKFVEVSQQEAEITRIIHTVCFWNRGEREKQGGFDKNS